MVKIIADSTCDLSQDLINKYDIDILPLHILLGEDEYLDGVNITPDDIYAWSDSEKTTPKTSAPSIADTMDIIEKNLVNEDDEIIFFTISKEMSTCYNIVNLAIDELDVGNRVFAIDSKNLSTGIGLQIIEAYHMAESGLKGEQIYKNLLALQPFVRASFVVDTLTFLHRGGRCSGLAAMMGSMLSLHPRIEVNNGIMTPGKKFRGQISRAVLSYAKDMENALLNAKPERVFITHSGSDAKDIDAVKSYLESLNYFKEIIITRAGSVISSHCGPGTLGVLFILK